MIDPGVVNQARGEFVIKGRRGEYPVAYTLGALEEFERTTGKVALSLLSATAEVVSANDIDLDSMGVPEGLAIVRLLEVTTLDVKQMVRCGLLGYAAHGSARGTPKLGDARLSEIIADCGGIIGVFAQVLPIWMQSQILMGDMLEDDGEDQGDTDADPT